MMDERLLNPLSTAELERRWAAARNGMIARKIDALVMQNNNDWLGGYVRWFTDTPLSNGYPRSIIFPVADLMTVVDMGAKGSRRKLDGSDPVNRGVGEMIFTPAFPHRRLGWQGRHAARIRGAHRMRTRRQGDIRRCDRAYRPAQGNQERGGEGACPPMRPDAGRGLCARAREHSPRHDRRSPQGGSATSRSTYSSASPIPYPNCCGCPM
jgi:hypothetical protein